MSNFDIIKDLMESGQDKGTSAYDTTAEVRRVDGDTAWVHIPGGVDETPVKLTISAKPGDTVQLRVGGGSAWLVGNQTAPPTDDTKANKAQKTAEKAAGTATDYVTDNSNGVFVHPKNSKADGVLIRDTVQVMRADKSVAEFGDTMRIGPQDGTYVMIDPSNMRLYTPDGQVIRMGVHGTLKVPFNFFGKNISITVSSGLTDEDGAATVFGNNNTVQQMDWPVLVNGVGNLIKGSGVALGNDNELREGVAIGNGLYYDVRASADPDKPGNAVTLVLGSYNKKESSVTDYALIIGNGDATYRSDAFKIGWQGRILSADGFDSAAVPVLAADCNACLNPFIVYYTNASTLNRPGTGNYRFVRCVGRNENNAVQVAYGFGGTTPAMWIRNMNSGDWGEWVRII